MNDLFKIFPELPGIRRRPLDERLNAIRASVDRVRREAERSATEHRATAASLREKYAKRDIRSKLR